MEHAFGIPLAQPLQTTPCDLPMDPYVLGAWLGDGHSNAPRITAGSLDRDAMANALAERTMVRIFDRPNGVADISLVNHHTVLKQLGVLGNKHIPSTYLRASADQRLDLLRGLLDTDGTPGAHSRSAEFVSIRRDLALGCAELARSLGYRAVVNETRAMLYGRDCGPCWRVLIAGVGAEVFALPRKAALVAARSERALRWSGKIQYLAQVERVPDQPVQCITVDSPAGLFLAGEAMIPTHNSTSAELGTVALGGRGQRRYG
jgi:hypothetical protein